MTSPYDAPTDLPEETEEAKCETDVTINLSEPDVPDSSTNSPLGIGWTGVADITITLKGGGNSFTATSTADGSAKFSAVPCGAYIITLEQDEFKITSLDGLAMNVTATRKSGREKDIKITRQIMTIEMFRLPTEYWESIRLNRGKSPNPTITADPYGHHWIQIYASLADSINELPSESYGWWPTAGAGFPDLLTGVPGELNGTTNYHGTSTRDPDHGKYPRDDTSLEDVFFPMVTNGKSAAEYKADIKSKAQGFSSAVSDQWSWRTDGGGWHCKTFQAYIMRETKVWKRLGVGWGSFGWSANP